MVVVYQNAVIRFITTRVQFDCLAYAISFGRPYLIARTNGHTICKGGGLTEHNLSKGKI